MKPLTFLLYGVETDHHISPWVIGYKEEQDLSKDFISRFNVAKDISSQMVRGNERELTIDMPLSLKLPSVKDDLEVVYDVLNSAFQGVEKGDRVLLVTNNEINEFIWSMALRAYLPEDCNLELIVENVNNNPETECNISTLKRSKNSVNIIEIDVNGVDDITSTMLIASTITHIIENGVFSVSNYELVRLDRKFYTLLSDLPSDCASRSFRQLRNLNELLSKEYSELKDVYRKIGFNPVTDSNTRINLLKNFSRSAIAYLYSVNDRIRESDEAGESRLHYVDKYVINKLNNITPQPKGHVGEYYASRFIEVIIKAIRENRGSAWRNVPLETSCDNTVTEFRVNCLLSPFRMDEASEYVFSGKRDCGRIIRSKCLDFWEIFFRNSKKDIETVLDVSMVKSNIPSRYDFLHLYELISRDILFQLRMVGREHEICAYTSPVSGFAVNPDFCFPCMVNGVTYFEHPKELSERDEDFRVFMYAYVIPRNFSKGFINYVQSEVGAETIKKVEESRGLFDLFPPFGLNVPIVS